MKPSSERWSADQAWDWYNRLPWQCGFNYLPSTSVNFIEFWRDETFDYPTIHRELALAASVGFNACRVNLVYELWEMEAEAMRKNLDRFLVAAAANGLSTTICFFDDCCVDGQQPKAGPQLPPIPGICNSRQIPSPAKALVTDRSGWGGLERYVTDIMTHFTGDERILCWDLYNEPGQSDLRDKSLPLLEASFAWARACRPTQPLTTGTWLEELTALNDASNELSDFISFHTYCPLPGTIRIYESLLKYGRPIVCTEWMARTLGSRVETHLPFFKDKKIGCYSWGLVNGRTQTDIPWSHLEKTGEWFHDLFHANGKPYRDEEIEVIKKLTLKA